MYDQQHHSTTSILPVHLFYRTPLMMYLISVTPKKSWESHVDVFFVGAEFFLLRKKPSLGGKFFPVATARATGDTHPKDTMHLSKLEKCCGEWRLAEIKGNTCNSNKVEAKTPGPEFKRASKESWQRCFFFNEMEHWIRKNHAKSWSTTWNFYEIIHPKYLKSG